MKRIIFFTMAFILSANTAFGAWLGRPEHDGEEGQFVLVYKNENLGSGASSGEDLMNMVLYGDAIMVDHGTKCYVLERKFSKAKVRVTSGLYAGSVGWVYIECLRE